MLLVVTIAVIVVALLGLYSTRQSTASKTIPQPEQPPPPVAPPARRDYKRPARGSVKLADLPLSDETSFDIGETGLCHYGIVGESNRQGALRSINAGRRRRGEQVFFIAELVLEPTNPYDPNAVKVCALGGDHIGYLPKDDAAEYQMALKTLAGSGKRAICRAKLIGGTEGKPSLGVMIDLRDPHDLLAAISPQPF